MVIKPDTAVRLGAPVAVAAGAVCACALIWIGDPTTPGGFLPVCPTKALLGVDCPGCGSLRMIYSLLHGDISAALHYNAVAMVGLVFVLAAYVTWSYGRLVGRTIISWQHHRWAAPVTLVIVVAWFVLRNLPFAPFTALRV